jgi:hypothetical protein
MDIWAVPYKCRDGDYFVSFVSLDAQAWAKHSEYYADCLDGLWMSKGEYEEMKDGLAGTDLTIMECSGKEN